MQRIVLSYGIITGLVIILAMIANMELGNTSAWLGFLIMFIAFSAIYFAIRQYRDRSLGGVIDFTTAVVMGLGISAVAGGVYVLVWELYLAATDYGFIDAYVNSIVEAQKLDGASEAELAEAAQRAEQFRQQYLNPMFRLPMTFLEVFPPGLLVTIVSGMVLRR